VHFLQIWILPARPGGKPGYEQKAFSEAERRGKWRLVASPDGRDSSVTINQDVALYASLPRAGETLRHELAAGRNAWLHVARGEIELGGERLAAGDAAAISDAPAIELTGRDSSDVLLFDLA
jgi:redox-sensitive bicupin YhaK (pirin superfamily)